MLNEKLNTENSNNNNNTGAGSKLSTKSNRNSNASDSTTSKISTNLPIIEPLQAPVYGGTNIIVQLPFELAEQANLDKNVIKKIHDEQSKNDILDSKKQSGQKKSTKNSTVINLSDKSIDKSEKTDNLSLDDFNALKKEIPQSSSTPSNSSIPALYLLITGSTQRHLCELQIQVFNNNYVRLSTIAPEHEPPEKTKVSLIVWRNQSDDDQKAEDQPKISLDSENLSSAMTLTSKFNYVIDQTCYLSVYLAQSVYDYDALEDWDSIEGPQFSLAREDFTSLDRRLCAAFDHLFLPDNWSLLGNAEDDIFENASVAAKVGLLEPRETLLHFASRLGLERTCKLLMTKPGANYCSQVRNRHGELPSDIARKNHLQMMLMMRKDKEKLLAMDEGGDSDSGSDLENLEKKELATKATIAAFERIEATLDR